MKSLKYLLMGWMLGALLLAGAPESPARQQASSEEETGIRILQPGSFHGDEVRATSGETWLGLYPDEYGFVLRPVTLQIDTVYDPVVDANPGKPSGKRVGVAGGPPPESQGCKALVDDRPLLKLNSQQPVLLIRGIDAPRTGRLSHGWLPRMFLYPGQVMDFDLGEHFYHLMAYGEAKEDNVLHQYRLLLWEASTALPLLRLERLPLFEAARPQVIWAGDLNGDYRLDLLLERSDDYNISDLTLFLSGEEASLKEVAVFRTTGC